ncbi:hypothetical protein Fot_21773 [Forsythia ovata]|uniref:Uncharacterized protein n=1 Tax=Forsythia ovata TaxID=205694 RepID=A0ABD1UVW4_9LAMI
MRDEDENTYIKQPDERSVGAVEWAPEVPQPPRRGRRSRARFLPSAPPVYPPYQPQGYEDQRESEEEEEPYSYASLVWPRAPFRGNEGVDPFQYPYHGYNVEKNYGNPNLPPRQSQEPETSQGSSVFDRFTTWQETGARNR